ncbi:MAG: potassium/proton antiporter [Rikenellaceae bacterium]|nr:potassium/proton antiporter [Rikenellaceae bacterium]
MENIVITADNFVLIGSILLFASVFAGKAGYKFGAPALLLFLGVGMIFGSDGLGIQFDNPGMAQFIGMLALSIILFSGGMDTKFSDIKPIIAPGITLATVGVALTAAVTGLFIFGIARLFHLEISLLESLLMAAVMSSTDSASVFSILRSKKQGLKQNLRPLLELESGSNDPMAYILTILLVQSISVGGISIGMSVFLFFIQMSLGALAGFVLGRLAVKLINRIEIGNASLYSVLLLACVFFVFAVTTLIKGNGYLAVYIAGLVIGNNKIVHKRTLTTFFDGFTWLFQIAMFLALGLLVSPHELLEGKIVGMGLLVGIFMIVLARPVTVFLCMLPFKKFTLKARLYVSWVGLRGAVPIIFATYPLVAGLPNAQLIFNVVFFITIISLVVQGTSVSSMARALGLSVEEKEDSFGIDLPDKVKAALSEVEVTAELLVKGDKLMNLSLPEGTLVVMIKRDADYFVPKGQNRLQVGDKLLVISDNDEELHKEYESLGILHNVQFK